MVGKFKIFEMDNKFPCQPRVPSPYPLPLWKLMTSAFSCCFAVCTYLILQIILHKLSLKYMREHQVKSHLCAAWYFVMSGFFFSYLRGIVLL